MKSLTAVNIRPYVATVLLVSCEGLKFCDLESKDDHDFVGLYICGIPTLIT